jgi:hypothetical protein
MAVASGSAIMAPLLRRVGLTPEVTSHLYSHCLVIHFAAHPPSKLWPKGIAACSHAEWAGSRALAERKATRWCKQPDVDTIEILDAIQV